MFEHLSSLLIGYREMTANAYGSLRRCRLPRPTFVRTSLVLLVVLASSASTCRRTQSQLELLTPIPNNQLRDTTPEQSSRVEQLRRLPTTQSVQFVQINLNALKNKEIT